MDSAGRQRLQEGRRATWRGRQCCSWAKCQGGDWSWELQGPEVERQVRDGFAKLRVDRTGTWMGFLGDPSRIGDGERKAEKDGEKKRKKERKEREGCEGREAEEAEDRERCLEMEMEQRGKVGEPVNDPASRFVPGLCTPSQGALCPRLAAKGWSSWRDPYRRGRKGSKDLRSRSGHLEESSKPVEVWEHSRVQPRSLLPPKPIPLCSRMELFF